VYHKQSESTTDNDYEYEDPLHTGTDKQRDNKFQTRNYSKVRTSYNGIGSPQRHRITTASRDLTTNRALPRHVKSMNGWEWVLYAKQWVSQLLYELKLANTTLFWKESGQLVFTLRLSS